MKDWLGECRALAPVSVDFVVEALRNGRGVSDDLLRRLVGHILRLEPLGPFERPDALPCPRCSGEGVLTADFAQQTLADLTEQIEREEAGGGSSRTRLALETGALSFKDCSVCNGTGRLPASQGEAQK